MDQVSIAFLIGLAAFASTALSLILARKTPSKVNVNFEAAIERIDPRYVGREHYFVYGKIFGNGFLLMTLLSAAFGDLFLFLSANFDVTTPNGFLYLAVGMGLLFTLGVPLIFDIILLKDYNLLLAITQDSIDYWEYGKQDSLAFSVKWSEVSRVQITTGNYPSPLGTSGEMRITTPTLTFELETFWANMPKFYEDILLHATHASISKRDRDIMEHREKQMSTG